MCVNHIIVYLIKIEYLYIYIYTYTVKPIIFCYYCDRTFENEKVLIQHQRAKHFKCIVCHKRLGSAHGMMVHVFQVHKQQIDKVPHAKEGRDSFHIDIFGMSNIPKEVIDEKHAERGILYYYLFLVFIFCEKRNTYITY